tara:strand:+ start:915 stop:2051 length:1137 start_codon:yes stop_codon:yes gene_type:complete
MSQKQLTENDRARFKAYRGYFEEYLTERVPTLKSNSIKLYSRSISLVAVALLPEDSDTINIELFLEALRDQYKTDIDEIDCIEIDLGGNLNNNNSLINAVAKLLETYSATEELDDKLSRLLEHIRTRSKCLRDRIAETKSRNHKTEEEEKHMRPFKEYVKVAEDLFKEYEEAVEKSKEVDPIEEGYKSFLPKKKFRDYILVTLILLNRTEEEGITLHSILRLVEYTDLTLWTLKKKPPMDGKNYLSLHHSKIFLQHSKTTGGMSGLKKKQPKLKEFTIFNSKIIDMIKLYVLVYNVANNQPLFTTSYSKSDTTIPLNKTALSKLLKVIFSSISPHTTIGLIRKAYDSQKRDMNGKLEISSARLNDHTLETISTFYKKI